MKFYIDSADLSEITKANQLGWLDGVTTNPSLMAKVQKNMSSKKTQSQLLKEICHEVDGYVSAEVISISYNKMLAEARELAKIHKNIVVKIPMNIEGLKVVKQLTGENIKTNVTLVFSATQALLAAKAGATLCSPFVGRIDDIGALGIELISQINQIYENYEISTQILVASVRSPRCVLESALIGADIVTIPPKLFTQLVSHPLTDKGLEQFLADSKNISQ